MHIGLMMECDFREGRTQREAFDEALATAEAAEALGFDGVWLAERHFAAPGGAAPVSSIGSAPLLLATAIATRTSRLRVGTAVLLLPLGHPVRLAEEVATLDHLSHGRLDLGIGRSSFPRSYEGYNIAYEESRARFREYLDVMRLAWTQERFSYAGTFYTFRDVELIPKPYQHPHPPLHHAATTRETFAAIGTLRAALPLHAPVHPGSRPVFAVGGTSALTNFSVQTIWVTPSSSHSRCARSRCLKGARWITGVDAISLGPSGS
jgi:alkanesulfonate monooxygenase SsuD/methylene tetrahydromethanopterin reductase-like flavin-dependent oxidoreductase (luciferase family)